MSNIQSSISSWKLLSSRKGYNHPFFSVREDEVQLPDGVVITDYTVWENHDVAQTCVIHDGKVLLVEQYKHGAQQILFELPGGFINKGEIPEDAARRELQEETGVVVSTLIPLTTCIHHPTKETGKTHLFLSTEISGKNQTRDLDATEDIRVHWLPIKQVFEMINNQKIIQTGTIAAIFLARERLAVKESTLT